MEPYILYQDRDFNNYLCEVLNNHDLQKAEKNLLDKGFVIVEVFMCSKIILRVRKVEEKE